jgi:hypothetical protein
MALMTISIKWILYDLTLTSEFVKVRIAISTWAVLASWETSLHCQSYKCHNVLVSMATETQHDPFCQFASTNPVDASNLLISKHILDHTKHGFEVLWCLDEVLSSVLDEIVKSWEHVLKVKLRASLESSVDELESLPHGWRNRFGGECTTIDYLKHLVI